MKTISYFFVFRKVLKHPHRPSTPFLNHPCQHQLSYICPQYQQKVKRVPEMWLPERSIEASWSIRFLCFVGGACILSMAVLLLIPILWPPIISYPWQFTNTAKERRQVVVLAGSFNPPHNGHLAMLQYLSKRWVFGDISVYSEFAISMEVWINPWVCALIVLFKWSM